MTDAPAWDLYRAFLAVLRHGSLSAAARALGQTQPTLARHVAALEDALCIPLFTRSPAGLHPTPAALGLRPHAEAMEAAAAALQRAASGDIAAERGAVRLTASEIVACEILPPILGAFRRSHPGINLELHVTNAVEDLLRRDADIAIRHTPPAQAALIARRIGTARLGLFAHRRYVAQCGVPDGLAALRHHTLLGFDLDYGGWREEQTARFGLTRADFGWRCDHDTANLAALRAGVGIGVFQAGLAAREPDLIRVLPEDVDIPLPVWLAIHEDLRRSRRVRLLFDALTAGLEAALAGA